MVREGSRRFATLEPLQTSADAPCTRVSPGKLLVEKVRYSRTTPNSCGRTLHTLLALVVREGSTEPTLHEHQLSRGKKCAGCLSTSLGWFKQIEPPRTFSNHILAAIASSVAFFHMRSGWFACAEPSLPYSLLGKRGVQGASARVSGWFTFLEPPRNFSNHSITEITRFKHVVREGSAQSNHPNPG